MPNRYQSIWLLSFDIIFRSQDCLEGIGGIDPHIGGDELHRICYDALKHMWLKWSRGYDVPIESTTLRGVKVHAAIAGKALTQPVKQRDAIWHFVYKIRGRATEPTFKAEQIDLAIVIDQDDFREAEDRREQAYDTDTADLGTSSMAGTCVGSNHSEDRITRSESLAPAVPASESVQVCLNFIGYALY